MTKLDAYNKAKARSAANDKEYFVFADAEDDRGGYNIGTRIDICNWNIRPDETIAVFSGGKYIG